MAGKQLQWHNIADNVHAIGWQTNNMAVVEVGGKKITLALIGAAVHAFAYKCPHASGIMANGFVDALGNVVCPLHRYKFNVATGRNVSGEGYYLKTYPVEIRNDGVFVAIESGGIFGW